MTPHVTGPGPALRHQHHRRRRRPADSSLIYYSTPRHTKQLFLHFVSLLTLYLCNLDCANADSFLLERIDLNTASATPVAHINNLVYHSGHVYVAAQNTLLKLSADTLQIEQQVRYGPTADSYMCRYNPVEECNNHLRGTSPNLAYAALDSTQSMLG